ncbi:MAG: restriction endonuclease [Prosthecobacter sp.]
MTIPTYQELMLPLLRVLGSAASEIHQKECTRLVAEMLQLSEEQRLARLPSGLQTYVHNRIGWAGWYMQQAGLLEKPKKGFLRITEEGRRLLAKDLAAIDNGVLATYPAFQQKVMKGTETDKEKIEGGPPPNGQTPTDQIEEAHQNLNATLASDLRDLMGKMDPYKFEQLVVDLLFAMGYGGSRAEAALVTQKSNDQGIDGIINEDRLGLDVIYVQAKRWQSTVGREPIQSFVGALAGKHANKGVFITTSDFHKNAVEYAKGVHNKVILIDGQRLAELMIEYGIGVSTVRTIALKRVDSDYFEEE